MRKTALSFVLACLWSLLLQANALAQAPTPVPVPAGQTPTPGQSGDSALAERDLPSLRGRFSFGISTGFDMDVFGDILNGGLGKRDGQSAAIAVPRPWPDVYVKVPRRTQATIGFSPLKRREVVFRLSKADYVADPFEAGSYAGEGAAATTPLTANFTVYRERSWEVGIRHYFIITRRAKQYANIFYGVRTIDPISASFKADSGVDMGTFRLYDKTKARAISLELAISVEYGRAGVFVEGGIRWQQRLKRNDDDLAAWDWKILNNTGPRIYMPLNFGVVFRL
jgi:hypothetical protein